MIRRVVIIGSVVVIALGVVAFLSLHRQQKIESHAFQEGFFQVTLPVDWTKQPSPDPTRWSYESSERNEALTVSLLQFNWSNEDERSAVFNRVIEIRRKNETAMPGTGVMELSPTVFGELGDTLAARYQGFDRAGNRHSSCLFLFRKKNLTVYFYESIGLSEGQSNARARAIMNSIVVH
jgi:hypothetical protein